MSKKIIGAGAKYVGQKISDVLKKIKKAKTIKKAKKAQETAGLGTKSIKPWNYRAGAKNEQIVPVKKQSQKGSSFQPHRIAGKQSSASIRASSEGSAASWRDEMERMYGDIKISEFFKKSTGGDINKPMNKKLSEKQMKIARMAPPPNKITGADFKAMKAKYGKMMKAKNGKEIKADPTKPVNPFQKKPGIKSKIPGRIGTALGVASMMVPAAYGVMKQYKDYKSAKNRDKAKVKKYNTGGELEVKQLDPLGKRLSDVGMMGGVGKMNKIILRNQTKAIQKIPNKNFKSPTTSGKEQKKLAIKEQKNIESKMTRKGQEYKPVITRSKGGGADASKKTFSSMAEMRAAKGFKPGETASQFNKRRMALEAGKKAIKASKYGKAAAAIAGVGLAAKAYLKSKMNKDEKPKGKMYGGSVKKYSEGMSYNDMKPYGGSYVKKKADMKASQTENVKKLTTSDDAYSPEKMFVVTRGTKSGSRSRPTMIRQTTDWNAQQQVDKMNSKGMNTKSFATYKLPPAYQRDFLRNKKRNDMRAVGKSPGMTSRKVAPRRLSKNPAMQKVPKYRSGVMVKTKLGRNKPTKIC